MSVSLAQGKYCDSNQLDPEDPRCAHVIFTGRMEKVTTNGEEMIVPNDPNSIQTLPNISS